MNRGRVSAQYKRCHLRFGGPTECRCGTGRLVFDGSYMTSEGCVGTLEWTADGPPRVVETATPPDET